MFETRIKIVLGVFSIALLVIVVRLIDLQIVRAHVYRDQAEQALLRPAAELPFARGRILDRLGNELAADRPCWEIAVDYGALAPDPDYIESQAKHMRREPEYRHLTTPQAKAEIHRRIDRMWDDLAFYSGRSVNDLRADGRAICDRIARVREIVARRRGFDDPIREERMRHGIVTGLDDQDQVEARRMLREYPWLEVRDSTYREYLPSPSLPHILGQLGAVTAKTLEDDPAADDRLGRYQATESHGISGVEHAAEQRLRGRRGLLRKNRAGETVEEIPAANGEDVSLTLRVDLQDTVYGILERMLPNTPHPAGAAVVVLDVPTREVLAMVSYPGYDNNTYRRDYNELARDVRLQPTLFRAVAVAYMPGSILKPLTCLAGLSSGRIGLDTTFDCRGHLFPNVPDRWRCWPNHATGGRMHHGPLDVSGAIANSCNIFMYKTGELVGVQGLCSYFEMAGLGEFTGMGLPEESRGINPTPSWLARRGRSVTAGMARLFAIGQGEVSITAVQSANLMSLYASGIKKEVTLIRGRSSPAEWELPFAPEHWRAIRSGLFRVANERGATAYRTAHFVRDGYALCGKTGSATVYPWVVSYSVPYATEDGVELVAIVPASSKREAKDRFEADPLYDGAIIDSAGIEAREYWPALGGGRSKPSKADRKEHAWFIAYLQKIDSAGRPRLDVTPQVAFAVLVEFGGSGGRAAGPIAVEVAGAILDTLGPELDPDGVTEDVAG